MKKRNHSKSKIGFSEYFCKNTVNQINESHKKITIEDVSRLLQDNNLKVTKSRLELIQLFIANDNHNLTINLILSKLRKINPKVNFSSVYNNLDILTKVGILRPNINIFTNKPTFESALDVVPHVHAYDINEQKQSVFNVDCELHDAVVKLFIKHGLIIEDYLIQAVVSKIKDSPKYVACPKCKNHKIEVKEFTYNKNKE